MKIEVTLTQEQWALVKNTYGRSALPQTTEDQRKHLRLYDYLVGETARDEEPLTIELSPGQRARVLNVMRFPAQPWATMAVGTVLKPIWVALGWVDDTADEGDDE